MYHSLLQIKRLENLELKKELKITNTVAKKMLIKGEIKTGDNM